jgi:hypothetical protein
MLPPKVKSLPCTGDAPGGQDATQTCYSCVDILVKLLVESADRYSPKHSQGIVDIDHLLSSCFAFTDVCMPSQ